MGVYPGGTVLPQGASDLLTNHWPHLWVSTQDTSSQYYLSGPLAPWPGVQDGVLLTGGLKGLTPQFKHIDLKSARQPGVTWTGTLYDVLEITMSLQAHAASPSRLSRVVSEWVGIWDPTQLLTLEYITNDHGYWYIPARLAKTWPDTWQWTRRTWRPLTQTVRCDSGFWFGMPHISTFQPGGSGGSDFVGISNIGSEDGWPTILLTGPGTFTWSNGPAIGTSTQITFGPLQAGQRVLITTQERLRGVIDLTSTPAAFTSKPQQALMNALNNYVSNNNTPPLLSYYQSLYGVYPEQGVLSSLLQGVYDNPFPGVPSPRMAQLQWMAVSITGGSDASAMTVRLDPQRRWPE